MKKLLLILMATCSLFVGCSCQKKNEEETKSPEISDYKDVEKDINKVIDRLLKNEAFKNFKYKGFTVITDGEYEAEFIISDNTNVKFGYKNEEVKSITISSNNFIKDDNIIKEFIDARKAVLTLDEFSDIKEKDFDNTDETTSYKTFVEIMNNNKSASVFTNHTKNIYISNMINDPMYIFKITRG